MRLFTFLSVLIAAAPATSMADAALDRCRFNFEQMGTYSMAVLEVCANQERQADRRLAKILKSGDQRAIEVCQSMGDFKTMSHAFFLVCYDNEVAATGRLRRR